jgi:hypothetical protein
MPVATQKEGKASPVALDAKSSIEKIDEKGEAPLAHRRQVR